MSNIIDKIRVSGTDYTLSATSSGGNNVVELTQAQYDALVTGGTVDPTAFYIITDATEVDISNYWTSAQTNSAITQAVSGKVDTSTFETYSGSVDTALSGKQDTLSAGTGIDITNNVISATGGSGGGKAVSGGTNISITTGETADTINCTLPISADTGGIYTTSSYPFISTAPKSYNAVFGDSNVIDVFGSTRSSNFNALFGNNNGVRSDGGNSSGHFIAGSYNNVKGISNYQNALFGYHNNSQNNSEFGCGRYNVSNKTSDAFGNSGNTLFSVGNGTADSARHNALEIRQNGDIYITLNGQDVKLQDNLGGGSITVSSAITSGDTNAVAGGAVYDKFDEVEQVTAAALNDLNDAFGGLKLVKLTQSAYNALSPNYDSNTLYIIVN